MLATMAVALLVIAALGAELVLTYSATRDSLDHVLRTLTPAATAASRLDATIDAMERTLRAYTSSGAESQRDLHEAARESADADLAEIDRLVGDDPAYAPLVGQVDDRLETWTTEVADPVLAATDDGEEARAAQMLASEEAQTALVRLNSSSLRLYRSIASGQTTATQDAQRAARNLAVALIVALVVLLLLPLVIFLVLGASVLRPIYRLRSQLRRAADPGHREEAISVGGPREVRDLGEDAEALRRALVSEIDQASAARVALEQEGPVVAAIRAELAASLDSHGATVPGSPEVRGVLRPAEGVLAGDFWDLVPLADGRSAIVVCDVSGHGPRAGIIALRLKTTFRLGLIAGEDLTVTLARACEGFAAEPGMFATAVILYVDPAGELTWVSAGHPAVRLLPRGGNRVEQLAATGPMISWLGGAWHRASVPFTSGDSLLAFSDGLLESRDATGVELGDEGLDDLLRKLGPHPPGELVERVLAWARQRAVDLGQDDLTIVAIRALAEPLRPGRIVRTPNR